MIRFVGLRIGLVGPLPPSAGGMANQTHQLAELLRAAHASVRLVQTNAPYRPAWVEHIPVLRALFRLLPYLRDLWLAAGATDLLHVMANSGWSWHLFAAPAIWVARLRRVPVVVNYRGGEAGEFLARSHRVVRWSMKRAAVLVVPSHFLAKVFGWHGMVAQIVPNIIDLTRFHPRQEACVEAGVELGGVTARPLGVHLLVARNLEPIYSNETAIQALALVRKDRGDARLTIAGTGPELTALRRLAERLDLAGSVDFVGRLDRDAMAALYRSVDIAINPSTADNMPNSVLEALASGVPVVSTDVGGVPYIVEHGHSALLVPPRDAEAMARAVLRLLGNVELAESLARTGREEVLRYTWERVGSGLASIYRRVAVSRVHP